MADDLSALEPWIAGLIESLSPGERRKLSRKVGQALRKANIARISRNVTPDGAAMEPRKKREGINRRIKGRMFPKLRMANRHRIRATPDGVTLEPVGALAGKAAGEHHFGQVGTVGRTRRGELIRTRYAERPLYGYDGADRDAVMDAVLAHLTK